MNKRNETMLTLDLMRKSMLRQVADLWDCHVEDTLNTVNTCEEGKVKVGFGVLLDFSDCKPAIEVRFALAKEATKDSRREEFDDPSQLQLLDPSTDTAADEYAAKFIGDHCRTLKVAKREQVGPESTAVSDHGDADDPSTAQPGPAFPRDAEASDGMSAESVTPKRGRKKKSVSAVDGEGVAND